MSVWIPTAWGDCEKGYASIEEAIEEYREKHPDVKPEDEISLGIGKDDEGSYWFCIGNPNRFTTCRLMDVEDWEHWFDEEWIDNV